MRAIIVDDEIAAIKVLSSLLADYEDLELVGCYTDPEKALKHFPPTVRTSSSWTLKWGP